ncbi:hypothetical protein [Haloarcula halophila]|uniref:hypothetical protein n=1 Tax=Haloarcula TaxID=2237 RepID=UPI0023E476D9|nr:hypothetical protein [Halomicroarcula sp. DFY41]
MVSAADSRGQLLLVGGIAIAIVFLLSIILTNSLVVTSYTATPESADRIEEVEDRETAVQQDLTTIATAVRSNTTFSDYNSSLNASLRNYTRYRTRVSGSQSGVYINATLNRTASEGNITSQTGSSPTNFQRPDPSGPGPGYDWTIANDVDQIVLFNLTLSNVIGGPSNTFTIEVTGQGGSGSSWRLEAVPSGGDIRIDTTTGTDVCPSGTSDPELNLIAGTCKGSSGPPENFTTFEDTLDKPYNIEIRNGNKVNDGKYWYGSTGEFPSTSYNSGDYSPYPITPAVDLTYTGPQTGYNRTIMLENST